MCGEARIIPRRAGPGGSQSRVKKGLVGTAYNHVLILPGLGLACKFYLRATPKTGGCPPSLLEPLRFHALLVASVWQFGPSSVFCCRPALESYCSICILSSASIEGMLLTTMDSKALFRSQNTKRKNFINRLYVVLNVIKK